MCTTCPFAITEASEQVQNYGCLPMPQEIAILTAETGRSWECHSREGRACGGAIENGVIGGPELNRYCDWYYGTGQAPGREGASETYSRTVAFRAK